MWLKFIYHGLYEFVYPLKGRTEVKFVLLMDSNAFYF